MFTAIPAISKIPSNHGPFNLPLQQALLKVAFGPLVAVVGIALLNIGAASQFKPATVPQVLLMAALFGAGQHAVTIGDVGVAAGGEKLDAAVKHEPATEERPQRYRREAPAVGHGSDAR